MPCYTFCFSLAFSFTLTACTDNTNQGKFDGSVELDESVPDCDGTLLPKEYFTICHNDDHLIPNWVTYLLTTDDLKGGSERTNKFYPDPDLPVDRRAEDKDYTGSGYDRGHMAPAGDFTRSDEAMEATFVLSNIAPQTPTLNRGQWASLENFVRSRTKTLGLSKIIMGNLFLNEEGEPTSPFAHIGKNQVAVPTHCWKALISVSDDSSEAYAFIMPNQDKLGGWKAYQTTIQDIEEITGLSLFTELSREAADILKKETTDIP